LKAFGDTVTWPVVWFLKKTEKRPEDGPKRSGKIPRVKQAISVIQRSDGKE